MKFKEVTLTSQHQITIPKNVCQVLGLHEGDRFEITVASGHRLVLKPKKLIDADDKAYALGKDIMEAEKQIERGETATWASIKRKHGL